MKYIFFTCTCIFIFLSACKKSNNNQTPVIPIEPGLQATFRYLPGTYWVYQDSVSGETDSAYVVSNTLDSSFIGCVLFAGQPKYQGMNISINVIRSGGGTNTGTEHGTFFYRIATATVRSVTVVTRLNPACV